MPPSSKEHGTTRAATGRSDSAPTVRNFRLDVVDGRAQPQSLTTEGGRCTIGSADSNTLVVDDPTVSRFHCEVSIGDHGIRIRDLGSTNGTYVGGTRIALGTIRDGDTMVLGDTAVRVKLDAELEALPISENDSFGRLVGASTPMRVAFAALEQAAQSAATVLLTGETGTGKEEAAIAIHQASDRANGPFIVVDCGALPSNLLESELFGHEKGAFTNALSQRAGAFQEAHGGTIFLDEIGELSLEMQPKLLRALESKQIRRLGSNRHETVDVRVIAATHRDLREQVNKEAFRADLYYRLAVICIELPSLRRRRGDIAVLARHLLERLGATPKSFERFEDPLFYSELSRGDWLGNVRELRNYLERCVVLGQAVLPAFDASDSDPVVAAVDASKPFHDSKRAWVERFEREYVAKLLALHDGKVTKAAQAAGIGRVLLWRLCNKHGLGKD